jgi:hypothetical protein
MDEQRFKQVGAGVMGAVAAMSITLALTIGRDTDSIRAEVNAKIEAAQEAVEPMTCADFDRGEYSKRVQELRAQDPNLRDLGGQCVQPGATATIGANFDAGTRIVGAEPFRGKDEFTLTGAARCEDKRGQTWCELTATNTSSKAELLLVLVRVEVVTLDDAGVGP